MVGIDQDRNGRPGCGASVTTKSGLAALVLAGSILRGDFTRIGTPHAVSSRPTRSSESDGLTGSFSDGRILPSHFSSCRAWCRRPKALGGSPSLGVTQRLSDLTDLELSMQRMVPGRRDRQRSPDEAVGFAEAGRDDERRLRLGRLGDASSWRRHRSRRPRRRSARTPLRASGRPPDREPWVSLARERSAVLKASSTNRT